MMQAMQDNSTTKDLSEKLLDIGEAYRSTGGKYEKEFDRLFIQLKQRNSELDPPDFLMKLAYLKGMQSFETIEDGRSLLHDIESLGLPIAQTIQDCLTEIEKRSLYIRNIYEKRSFDWTNEDLQAAKELLRSRSIDYAHDEASKTQYLKEEFQEALKSIKALEIDAVQSFGYHIDNFYSNGNFVATAEDVNSFFFHSEMHTRSCKSFYRIWRLLRGYIDSHKRIHLLKTMLREGQTDLATIFTDHFKKHMGDLLLACGIMDDRGHLAITPGKGGPLFGLIVSLRRHSKTILKREYNYPELLKVFNEHLKTNYKEVKPHSQSAKTATSQANAFITRLK
jgi:hypothetical protein